MKSLIGVIVIGIFLITIVGATTYEDCEVYGTCQDLATVLSNFLSLTDTPATYTGAGTQCVKVNAGETALEFGACGGGDSNFSSTDFQSAFDANFSGTGFNYNMTDHIYFYNQTESPFYYNQTDTIFFYNMTPSPLFYNQTIMTNFFDQNLNTTSNVTFDNILLTGMINATFNWSITPGISEDYIGFDGTYLNFSESQLNDTIDSRTQSTTYLAENITTHAGTFVDGNLTSIQIAGDVATNNGTYNVTEAGGASPVLTIQINFTNVLDFNIIQLREKYIGGSGHEIAIGLYNCVGGGYEEEYGDITDMEEFAFSQFNVLDPQDHLCGGGNVSLQLRHEQNGIATHQFFLDYAVLVDGFTTITTTEHDALSGRDDIENHPWALDTAATRNISGNLEFNDGKNLSFGDGGRIGVGIVNPEQEVNILGSLNLTADLLVQSINVTQWLYNQTESKFFYNMTTISPSLGYNMTDSPLFYNQTTISPSLGYNMTPSPLFYNQTESKFFYNMSNTTWLYNQTPSPLFYNQTDTIFFYNQTPSPLFYNQTDTVFFYNMTTVSPRFDYNQTDTVFFYNQTPSPLFYNQTTISPSLGYNMTPSPLFYNQTDTVFFYNMTTVSPSFDYNQTDTIFFYNQTPSPLFYNQTDTIFFYNQTPSPLFYNQTIMSNIFDQDLNTTNNVDFNDINATGDLLVDGGDIGISVDTDLIQLSNGVMRVNGFFGVGAAPGTPFDIFRSSDSTLRFRTSNVDGRLRANDAAGSVALYPTTNHKLTLGSNNNAERMTIATDGNVGIGTTTPTFPLTVVGNVSDGSNLVSIWADSNISATGYITRTSIFDKSKNVWDYIKDSDYYKIDNKINHSRFYGSVSYPITDFSIPVNQSYEQEVCEDIFEDVLNKFNETNSEYIRTDCHNETLSRIIYPYNTTEEGVELGMEIDVLRQAVFELKEESSLLKEAICELNPTAKVC